MDKEKLPHTETATKPAEQKQPAAPQEQKAPEKKHEAAQAPAGEAASDKAHAPREEKKEKKCECDALSDKCLRLTAEFDNYKKRTAKEKEALALHSEARMMLRLLPIYEEIGLAEKEVARLPDSEAKKGTLLVLAKLRKSFESDGLLPMKLAGVKLDPFRHEVALREDSDAPEGTIVRVIKQGYLYKGEVLQHAIVSVSSGKKPGGQEAEKSEEKQEVSP